MKDDLRQNEKSTEKKVSGGGENIIKRFFDYKIKLS